MDLKRWGDERDHLPLVAGKRGAGALGGLQRPSDNYIQPINDRQPAGWACGVEALREHVWLTLRQTEISVHVERKEEG